MINVSVIDRIARAAVGVGVMSLYFVGPKSVWGALGLIPLLTAVTGYCPFYRVFGVRTKPPPPKTSV